MKEGLITGVFTLGAVVITFIGNYFLNITKLERERKSQDAMLVHGKLEEVCQIVEDIRDSYGCVYIKAISTLVDLKTKGSKEISAIMPKDMKPLQFTRLRMLIDFYAKNLMPLYECLEGVREVYGNALVRVGNMTIMDKEQIKNLENSLDDADRIMDEVIVSIAQRTANFARDIRT